MFRNVASRYDFINSLLSLGLDGSWRDILAQKMATDNREAILDVACGSGAVVKTVLKTYRAARKATPRLTGVDFCPELLALAKADKQIAKLGPGRVEFIEGDALKLPFADASFDGVSVAWGLRNFADRPRFYAEAARVLKPNGALYILEFSQPYAWVKPFYHLYQKALPTLAHLFGGPTDAYAYLNTSINAFPSAPALAKELEAAGFARVGFKRLTFGVLALHWGQKG